MKITLPIYFLQKFKTKKSKNHLMWMNFYRNAHCILLNNIKQYYTKLVLERVKSWIQFEKPIIHYKVYLKNTASDGWNIRSVIEKFALDWLVKAKVFKDDNVKIIKWDTSQYFIDKSDPRCEIYIEETK